MRKLINYIMKRRAQKKDFDQLWAMSDRELNDLGIARCDIHRIVYDVDWGRA